MTPDQMELAKQLVAQDWWGAAMEADSGHLIRSIMWCLHTLPDLTDDATGGVLLGMLAQPGVGSTQAEFEDGQWAVYARGQAWYGITLAEACAKALLAVR